MKKAICVISKVYAEGHCYNRGKWYGNLQMKTLQKFVGRTKWNDRTKTSMLSLNLLVK